MELQFLGTGAGVPAKHRNVTSIALKLLDERNEVWLFDCGEGTQMQILRTSIRPRKIEKIFITHLHGDHIFGLPGLLSSRSFQGGDTPLEIYGPKGIEMFIKTSLAVSQTRLGYALKFIELTEDQPIFEDQQFSVYTKKLDHGIDSFGYRVVEHDHKGELQVDKLKELAIPAGPIYGKLKKGETVTLDDGRTINGKAFVGPDKKGRIVTILGDTRKTGNSVLLAQDSDVLVHESTFNKNEEKMARNYYHSTTHQAAEIAKEAKTNKLLLTHISARYLGKAALELENEAKEIFPNTLIMKDFETIEVPFREEE
ncbi:ribonuclease Z [Enterococcus durans]|uniref:Ribonuclease Z n=1 Tax=Enterococcus durans TaxID=53345 RepID=A0A5N0YPB3_9ENTE|nr:MULTISPECIES: ribonuclease Z [Enterococcus]KAA9178155.1 ribonuclease Z [Enterococcus durans]KAA9182775.1 ribonuclease Z [Enterococcus durans]KAA9185431.1 ribonuclease Z [Enterococcus durans]KAA9189799.1 ribonuclease Z [Enterococcus durans]KAA9191120.1 ribonuclease Z [Enterococcus durans]